MSFGKPRISVGSYAVTRTALGTTSVGRKVPGSTSSFNIDANVQPAPGKMVEALPESRRTNDVRLLFTDTELYAVMTGYEPDRITIGGVVFEVLAVRPWPRHYEVLAASQGRP